MRTKVLVVVLMGVAGFAAYLYTQTDVLESPRDEESAADLVARSRAKQAASLRRVSGAPPRALALPTERPMIGPAGLDPWGYPLMNPDRIGLRALLLAQRYDELGRYLTEYQDAADADPHKERWPMLAFDSFAVGDPSLTAVFDRWVVDQPRSFAAALARGQHRVALAWRERGQGSAARTHPDRLRAFMQGTERANEDLRRSIELRATATAYQQLIANARLSVDRSRSACDCAMRPCSCAPTVSCRTGTCSIR